MSDLRVDPTTIMVRSLDALAARQRVTANNVANADTPNFKRSEVRFETALQEALGHKDSRLLLARTDAGHLISSGSDSMRAEVVQLTGTTLRNDGNNVDIEQQMATLAETQLRFNAVTEALARSLAMRRMIATDGR